MRLLPIGKKPIGQDDGVWVEHKLPGGWVAYGRMVVQGSRVVMAELRIARPAGATPPGGVTRDLVRGVPCGRFGPFVLATAAFARSVPIGGVREHFDRTIGRKLGRLPTARPRARRASGRDDVFYAKVAKAYLTRLVGGSRKPIQDLAAEFEQTPVSMRDMVREARERGLLTMSEPGKVGGRLTPLAEALLNQKGRVTTMTQQRDRGKGGL